MCCGSFNTLISFIILLTLVLSVEEHKVTYHSSGNIREKTYTRHKTTLTNSNSSSRPEVLSYTLAEALRRTFNEFEELFENIVDSVTANVPKILQDTDIFLVKLTDCTKDALNIFGTKVLNTGDQLLNEMFYSIEHELGALKQEFQNLAESVDQHFDWAVNQLNQTLMNNTAEYDLWTGDIKHKLRFVNDSYLYKDGCKTIDEFIQRSNIELQNCCKITMKPMQSLCTSATSLLSESLHIIVDTVDRMQTCLEDNNSYADYLVPCINLAYDDINNVLTRTVQVRHLVDKILPMKILYTRNCFVIVMVDMKHQRNVIESNLFEN